MSTKEVLSLIFVNPFKKIAGWQALGLGLVFVVSAAVIASYSGAVFNSAIDYHPCDPYPTWQALTMLAIDLGSVSLLFLLAGILFSKNFRVIDVIGTVFLAYSPYLFFALMGFIPMPEFYKDTSILLENPKIIFASFSTIFRVFVVDFVLMLLLLVWFFALLYNAFRVSLNIRKTWLRIVVFIIVMILATVLSKIIINYVL
jgi:hypothetical protein